MREDLIEVAEGRRVRFRAEADFDGRRAAGGDLEPNVAGQLAPLPVVHRRGVAVDDALVDAVFHERRRIRALRRAARSWFRSR